MHSSSIFEDFKKYLVNAAQIWLNTYVYKFHDCFYVPVNAFTATKIEKLCFMPRVKRFPPLEGHDSLAESHQRDLNTLEELVKIWKNI